MQSKNNYALYAFIDIRFGDPVTALAINEQHLLIGTTLGKISLFALKSKNQSLISESNTESITGITFDGATNYLIAIGDEEVLSYKGENLLSCPTVIHYKNYQNESDHINFCDFAYTVLYDCVFFKIILQQPDETNLTIARVYASYEIKNLKTKIIQSGEIEMTNYVIPFDFNIDKFLSIEFLTDVERCICVYNFPSGYAEISSMWKFPLKKEFGHISHAKLIKNTNKIFLVKNLKNCDIRECDVNFSLIYTFDNIGDKVISVQILPVTSPLSNDDKFGTNNIIIESDHKISKHNTNAINNHNNINNAEDLESKDECGWSITKEILIFLLDIEGNINVFTDNSIKTIANLYKLKDLSRECKEKRLFELGYKYEMSITTNFIAVSNDHGVIVIRKKED